MTHRKKISFTLVFILLAFAFNNCSSGGFNTIESFSSLALEDSQSDNNGAPPTPSPTPTPTSTPTPGPTVTPSPTPTPTPPMSGARDVSKTVQVPALKQQTDFLIVIDNSASMKAVQAKFATSMNTLVKELNNSNTDWQMCLTVTSQMNSGGTEVAGSGAHTCTGSYCSGTYSGGTNSWGPSMQWKNGNPVLNNTTYNANKNIFSDTINAIGSGDGNTGDERGVKAVYNHFENWRRGGLLNTANCYRKGSAVAVILLSDEDERSVAGDCSRVNTALGDKEIPTCREASNGAVKVLESEDQPANLAAQANSVFGSETQFTFNSVVTDTALCQTQLDQTSTMVNGFIVYSPHYIGTVYMQASQLTKGGIISLCAPDWQLNSFISVAKNTLSTLSLECVPTSLTVRLGATEASAKVAAPLGAGNYTVSGTKVNFTPPLQENSWVSLEYHCSQ